MAERLTHQVQAHQTPQAQSVLTMAQVEAGVAPLAALTLVAVVKAQFALSGLRVINVYSQQTG
jgi:extradiol dioxygenase family protein